MLLFFKYDMKKKLFKSINFGESKKEKERAGKKAVIKKTIDI